MSFAHTRSGSSSSINHRQNRNSVLNVSFNQDHSCFAVGLESGFSVYTTEPLKEVLRREFDDGGIGQASMLYRTNLIALVGGGRTPKFAPNKVILFDEKVGKVQAELEFRSEVRRVLLRKDRIAIVLDGKVHIYSMEKKPKLLSIYDTYDNPNGICAINSSEYPGVIAFPASQLGHVCIVGISNNDQQSSIVAAHKSFIAALAINPIGSLLATASEKGTLLRVFEIKTGRILYELRRGADRAEIYDICFSHDSTKVCASSDKGTVHIFSLDKLPISTELESSPPHDPNPANRQSSLSFMKEILPKYFASQWSFAQCKVSECKSIACFGVDPSTVCVISKDGYFYRFRFDTVRGGDCIKEYFAKFINSD